MHEVSFGRVPFDVVLSCVCQCYRSVYTHPKK